MENFYCLKKSFTSHLMLLEEYFKYNPVRRKNSLQDFISNRPPIIL